MSQKDAKCLTKTNLLVYQTPQGKKEHRPPCSNKKVPAYSAVISRVRPKVIKICTGAEMKKMCPPPCDCSAALPKNRFGAFAALVLGLKAAIAATLVYVSYDMGVWGSTDDTQDLYKKYCSLTSEPRKKNDKWDPPSCEAQKNMFPSKVFKPYEHCNDPAFNQERSFHKFQNCWNHGVETVFGGLAGFPNNLLNWYSGAKEKRQQQEIQIQKCIPYSQLPPEQRVVSSYK